MQDHPELEARGVSVIYDGARRSLAALSTIDLSIGRGDFVAVLGPSGSGKTTLLNVFAGLVRPTSGEALFRGNAIRGPGADRGVVFQRHALLPWLDVTENIAFPLRLRGIGRAQRRDMVAPLVDRVGLGEFAEHPVWMLSGGMQQRVGLARALAAEPAVLLLDEPLGALDQITREELQRDLLRLWVASNTTAFLITHDIEEAVFLATHLIVLSDRPGRVVERLDLPFSRRIADGGEDSRRVRSEAAFVDTKNELRSILERKVVADDLLGEIVA